MTDEQIAALLASQQEALLALGSVPKHDLAGMVQQMMIHSPALGLTPLGEVDFHTKRARAFFDRLNAGKLA